MAAFIPPDVDLPLPDAILQVGDMNPDRVVFLCIQSAPSATAPFTEVTWDSFMKHVKVQARYLSDISRIKSRGPHEEVVTVGFIAESTYNFAVTLFAMLLLRWTPVLISSRNSVEAISQLMRSTGAHVLFIDESLQQSRSNLLDTSVLGHRLIIIQAAAYLRPIGAPTDEAPLWFAHPARQRKFWTQEELRVESARPAVFIHTSGSTGHPKAIPRTHRNVVATANVTNRSCMPGDQRVMYTCLPAFHGGAFNLLFSRILGAGGALVLQERWQPVSASLVISHMRLLSGHLDEAALPPSILEQLAEEGSPRDIDVLKTTKRVFWGGASLRKSAGDFLQLQGVNLICWCGITEAGLLSKIYYANDERQDPGDWEYMALFDGFSYTFIPMEHDLSRFKLVVSAKEIAPALINHGYPTGFMTPDAWEKHPQFEKLHYVKPVGRLDDVTVLSNGEKTDNKQLEYLLTSSSLISQAVVFGSGRALNGVIITPSSVLSLNSDLAEYLNSVWLHIDTQVNRTVPRHSRLLRSLVIVATPDKPFIHSDKRTIKSHATLALYSKEIEEVYAQIDNGVPGPLQSPFVSSTQASKEDIAAFVCRLVEGLLVRSVPHEADLFALGLDSLTSTALRAYISAALRKANLPSALPRDVIYAHPSVTSLSSYLHSIAGGGLRAPTATAQADLPDYIASMIRTLTEGIPQHLGCLRTLSKRVFAITGTTGSLGVSFLAYLLPRLQDNERVFLLNRRHPNSSLYERHERAFTERLLNYGTLEQALKTGKAMFIEIDVEQPQLGLGSTLYDMLSSCVTHIIHIAWPINFNLTLSSLKPQLTSVRSIIDLALSSKLCTPSHITFVSSIGVVWNHSELSGGAPIPEVATSTLQSCIPMGYAWAKHVAERVLHEAALKREGLRVAIVRCGQLSGIRSTGAWPRLEYMPRLLRASVALGMVPDDLEDMHWIPVDDAAKLLYLQVQSASFDTTTSVRQFNIENTRPLPWRVVVRTMCSMFRVTGVPSAQWLEAVRADRTSAAYAICDYLADRIMSGAAHRRPALSMDETAKLGGDVCPYIDSELVKLYIKYSSDSDC